LNAPYQGAVFSNGSPRRRPVAGGIAKPPIVSALSMHGQEKPDIFHVVFHWMRAEVKLATL
jgi:hypothetical protein